jgi:hypothetical protein
MATSVRRTTATSRESARAFEEDVSLGGDGGEMVTMRKKQTAVVRVLVERSAYSSMPSKRADFLRAIKFFSGGVG